jgi:hypothetical protein
MFMPYHCTARQNYYINVANIFLENMAKFKDFRMIVTNQIHIHKETVCRLNMGNACYHAFRYILSSHSVSKTVKIKICKNCYVTQYSVWA